MIMKIGTNGEYLFQKTKIKNFFKMLGERCETWAPLKVLQNRFKVIYCDQTTIETSTLPAISMFKRSNPIL